VNLKLEIAENARAEAGSSFEVKTIIDQTAAIAEYARQAKDTDDRANHG
jgi:hypothetical protein